MANWMIRCSELLELIYQRLKATLLQQAVINADETPLNVFQEERDKCYMWVYCSSTDSPKPDKADWHPPNLVLYEYQNSRRGQCPKDFLEGFSGYLQVDGYQGYEQTDATLVGCFAHARRKCVEVEKAQPKGKSGRANWAISHLKNLYRIESEIKALPLPGRHAIRQQQARPVMLEFKGWLEKSALQVPPKSAIGKVIAYSLNKWSKLERYLVDSRLSIDNNRAERAVKPFVIGRKDWLFSNTANGARVILYSLVKTAKANGLIPFDYLNIMLEQIPKQPQDIDQLLPWNIKSDQ